MVSFGAVMGLFFTKTQAYLSLGLLVEILIIFFRFHLIHLFYKVSRLVWSGHFFVL